MNVKDKIDILHLIANVLSRPYPELAFEFREGAKDLYSRKIPGFPGYRATIDGTILGPSGNELATWEKYRKKNTGYQVVAPYVNGKKCPTLVHKLVVLAFQGPLAEGEEIHHKNFNRGDNRPENLYVCKNHEEHVNLHRRHIAENYF